MPLFLHLFPVESWYPRVLSAVGLTLWRTLRKRGLGRLPGDTGHGKAEEGSPRDGREELPFFS